MKKYILLLTILCSIAAWSGDGLCQPELPYLGCPQNALGIDKPGPAIYNTKNHPHYGSGTYFIVGINNVGNLTGLMNGLERISVRNYTNPESDGYIYECGLTPTLRHFSGEFSDGCYRKFEGQFGVYEVTIERTNRPSLSTYLESPFRCYTDPIDPGLTPLPVPKNLRVSFKSGATTPTLSFDPVSGFPSETNEWYEIRIYDKGYTRRIYSVTIGAGTCGWAPCSKTDGITSVTFPGYRAPSGQTYEALVPGETYLFRAELIRLLPGVSPINNANQSTNFISFVVPAK